MRPFNWKLTISLGVSILILLLAYLNRRWLIEALHLLPQAEPLWLVVAFFIIMISFLIISQVFHVILRSIGYEISILRLWATALVSIVLSQSIPAGGVWSYAFLVGTFKRQGLTTVQATLVATLDILSYSIAMLLIVSSSMIYLAIHNLTAKEGSYLAATIALLVVMSIGFILTRSEAQLIRWFLGIKNHISRMTGQTWNDDGILHVISEIVHGRQLIASNPRDVLMLAPIQFFALCGHCLAMLLILHSFGVEVSFAVVITAFGIGLMTSVFNVLPGGGGTVETALVAVLIQLGVGVVAVPAAIIFRLMNFWFLLPIAAACYYWLMHSDPPDRARKKDGMHGQATVQNLRANPE